MPLPLSVQQSLSQFMIRQSLVKTSLDSHFSLQRRFSSIGPYVVQDIISTYSSIQLTVEEVQSYVQGLVIAKRAEWIFQERTTQTFLAVLGSVMPPANTPFRLI